MTLSHKIHNLTIVFLIAGLGLLFTPFRFGGFPFSGSVYASDALTDLKKLMDATKGKQKAQLLEMTKLTQLGRDEPVWPIYSYLAGEIFKMRGETAKAQKAYLKKDKTATGDVTGIIGITGEALGTISVSFSASCILSIVSKMFGEEMSELNEDIRDAVGELTNMISGQARQQLEATGWLLKAAIPTVIMGKNHTISHITDSPIIAIPFQTDMGNFAIEICMAGKPS